MVDWDIHHGNGTQHTFQSDPRYLPEVTRFISVVMQALFIDKSNVQFKRQLL